MLYGRQACQLHTSVKMLGCMPALLLAQALHAGRGQGRSLTCCEPALLNHEGAPRGLHNSSRIHLGLALQDSKGAVTVWPVSDLSTSPL